MTEMPAEPLYCSAAASTWQFLSGHSLKVPLCSCDGLSQSPVAS